MGFALASEARDRGAEVILISGPVALDAPYGVDVHRAETSVQMRDAVRSAVVDAHMLVMSAPVAAYPPPETAAQKPKKGGPQEPSDQNGFSLRPDPTPHT